MKILMLNNEYPPLGGGQASANKNLIDVLQSVNYQINVDLITSAVSEFRVERNLIGEIVYLNIGKQNQNLHYQNVKDLLTFTVKSFFFARKRIRQNKYDYVIAWAGVPSGFIAYFLHLFFNIPYVVLLRGPDVPFHEAKWKWLDKCLLQFASPFVWRRAHKVIANSLELKKLAQESAKKQLISVIENGVDFDFWNNPLPKQLIDFERIIILSVGRISKIKGFDLVIKAISEINDINIEYQIVGDGPEKANLTELAKSLNCNEKVKFWGVKNKAELRQILHSSTIFCLPSYNEGMSNALMEAMACSLPVIVTNVGGTQELINENGIIIEKGDWQALRDAIVTMLRNNDTYMKFRNQSAEIAKSKSWKSKTEELMNEIIDN